MNAGQHDENVYHPGSPGSHIDNLLFVQHLHDDDEEVERQGCLPLCALCACPLETRVIRASAPGAEWYPPVREQHIKSLYQTTTPYLGLPNYQSLSIRQLVAIALYDPKIIDDSKVEWLEDIRAVGYQFIPDNSSDADDADDEDDGEDADDEDNEEDVPAPEDEIEVFVLDEPMTIALEDDDNFPAILPGPNDAGLDELDIMSCFNHLFPENEDELHKPGPAIPFHSSCRNLLAKFLQKEHNIEEIEPSLLYMAIRERVKGQDTYMSDFDYIGIPYNHSRWIWLCRPGFEYLVLDPTGNSDAIKQAIQARAPRRRPSVSVPAGVANDAFYKLPTELRQAVMEYLRPEGAQALITASWAMYLATADNEFWRRYALRELPWLFELADLAGRDPEGRLNYKDICFWMEEASVLEDPGREDMFLSLVNRRRLWWDWKGLGRAYEGLERYAGSFQAVLGAAGVGQLEWMRESLVKGTKLLE